jgi:hypothetical protein
LRRSGEPFRLGFKGEDKCGNPSDQVEGTFALRAYLPVQRLPETISMRPGEHAKSIDGLSGSALRRLCRETLFSAMLDFLGALRTRYSENWLGDQPI